MKETGIKTTIQLNEDNYRLWLFQMEILLEEQNCLQYDENGEVIYFYQTEDESTYIPAVKECAKSKLCMINNVSPAILSSRLKFKSAEDMWQHLFQEYSGENHSRKLQGIKAIASISYSGGSIPEFMDKCLETITTTITAAGKDQISLTELTLALLLNALPNRFAAVRAFLEQDQINLTLQPHGLKSKRKTNGMN
jgi:hypothetical protein